MHKNDSPLFECFYLGVFLRNTTLSDCLELLVSSESCSDWHTLFTSPQLHIALYTLCKAVTPVLKEAH